jgi:hypothetical protein
MRRAHLCSLSLSHLHCLLIDVCSWCDVCFPEKLEARLANQVHWSPAGGSCVLVALRSAEDKTLEFYDVGMKDERHGKGRVAEGGLCLLYVCVCCL